MPDLTPTLSGADYCSDEIYDIERTRIFHEGWFVAVLSAALLPGNRRVVDVAGESVLIARSLDGTLHAHANVCRHRGARLCDDGSDSTQGSLMCPYHAWTYALDGRLIATPHLANDVVDKDSLSLWSIAAHEWQGLVFVSMAKDPISFDRWIELHGDEIVLLERFNVRNLQVAYRSTSEVAANWKIIVENYQECLHCTRVHPELVDIVPIYRSGWVHDHDREDGGVRLLDGGNSFSMGGHTDLPLLPGMNELDASSYYGCTMFPNAFVDITGTAAIATFLYPKGPNHTTVVMEFLFAAETIADPAFDPSAVIEFNELVGAQDNMVCERVQQGVSSRKFDHGVLTEKDDLVIGFVDRYLAARGPIESN